MDRVFAFLLILSPLALVAGLLSWPPIVVFLLSAAAIVPLARYIGDATEDLALRTNPAIGGLLNATFGNATELIVSVFAIEAGLVEVAKAAITGAIIGNLLLVLGTAMYLGGRKRERQHFNATAAKAACSMLVLATTALVVPAIFLSSSGSSVHVGTLSVLVALLMIIAYIANLTFTLHTHKHLYKNEQADERAITPKWSASKATLILFFATVAVAILSELLVNAINPVVESYGWTQLFIGVIVVAIIGNVAEHLSAVTAAVRNKMDLSIQIAVGSATQVVMFVAPVLVLASQFFASQMNLVFNSFELVSIVFAVFVTNAVVEDGESNWFEGFQLITAYVIIAVAFFLHP